MRKESQQAGDVLFRPSSGDDPQSTGTRPNHRGKEEVSRPAGRKIVVIGGPTASGKNAVALALSRVVSCEFVNADSRQIYRGLTIGTNVPDQDELMKVPHHLFAFLEPSRSFSAADYEERAVSIIDEIFARGNLPVVIGGTGFYIKALLKGLWPVPPHDPDLRSRFKSLERTKGKEFLYRLLQRVDPDSARQISVNDVYRVIRAVEIFFQTGEKRSAFTEDRPDRWPALKFYLDPGQEVLQENIRRRTEWMFQRGWVQEVHELMQAYAGFEDMPAAASIGYREIVCFLRGDLALEQCKENIILQTRQYAKRQLTWFRNQDSFASLAGTTELNKIIGVIQLTGF